MDKWHLYFSINPGIQKEVKYPKLILPFMVENLFRRFRKKHFIITKI